MKLSLPPLALLVAAASWHLSRSECEVTVTSEQYSCDAILSTVPAATCDGCYLFCDGAYSRCVSSLDEAGCDQTEVASVCGDEQRPEEDQPTNDAVAIDGQQVSGGTDNSWRRGGWVVAAAAALAAAPLFY